MIEIDIPLLRLRYEILNVPLETLAKEVNIPFALLEREAASQNWEQWWPDLLRSSSDPLDNSTANPTANQTTPTPTTAPDVDTLSPFDEPAMSALEEGASQYMSDARIRLQVFNLAKDIHLAHKYASFESVLIDKAKGLVETVATAQDARNLAALLKDARNIISTGISLGNTDGLPTVIVRDLTGRSAI